MDEKLTQESWSVKSTDSVCSQVHQLKKEKWRKKWEKIIEEIVYVQRNWQVLRMNNCLIIREWRNLWTKKITKNANSRAF